MSSLLTFIDIVVGLYQLITAGHSRPARWKLWRRFRHNTVTARTRLTDELSSLDLTGPTVHDTRHEEWRP